MRDDRRQAHWDGVCAARGEAEASWFQEIPAPPLDLIALTRAPAIAAIIDIGGGASRPTARARISA